MPKATRAPTEEATMSNEITLQEVRALLATDSPTLVLEILAPEQYARAHLPGARNLPLAELDQTAARLAPDPETPLVTYCSGPTCANSRIAARRLVELGYRNVRVFEGGKAAWRDAGLPFEAEASVTRVA
jgi:rhodanese-related sulfurtransferase